MASVLAAGLIIVGMVTFKPIYRVGKGWRARQLSQQAEAFIATERWDDAMAKARAAYQLKPDEPAAVRAVARLQSAAGRPAEAIPFWRQLQDMAAMTTADRGNYAEDLFHTGAVAEARQENATLLAREPNEAANLRLAAQIAAATGNRAQGIDYARRANLADPAHQEGRLLYALLRSESDEVNERPAGLQALLELATDHGKIGLTALMYLAGRRDLPRADVGTVVSLLRNHPLATESQRLAGLDAEINADPAGRGALLDRTCAEYRTADPAKRRALGVWLNAHGEFQRTLDLIPIDEAFKRKDLLLVHLDALAALKQWKEIQRIVEEKNVPLDDVYSELFQARSALELGQATIASLHWTRAHTAAAPSVEQMWFLGNYAEKIGQTDQAELAYQSLKSNATTARPAYEALLRLAEKRHDLDAERDLLREMRQRWPQDSAVANDYAYLSLLSRREVEECTKIARGLVAQSPASLPHRTTLALALLRSNDPSGALGVYAGLQIPWDRVPASARAVHAAVLGQNGDAASARAEAASIRLEDLRPDERELIKPWRTQ